jgi:hypothetical protein
MRAKILTFLSLPAVERRSGLSAYRHTRAYKRRANIFNRPVRREAAGGLHFRSMLLVDQDQIVEDWNTYKLGPVLVRESPAPT